MNRVAIPALAGTIEEVETRPAGPGAHPGVRTMLVWNHRHLTDACTSSLPLLQAMCVDELALQGEVRWS